MVITPARRSIVCQMDRIHTTAEQRTTDTKAREYGFYEYTSEELEELKRLHKEYKLAQYV